MAQQRPLLHVRARKGASPGDPTKESSLLLCLDATAADGYNPELMRVVFALRQRLLTLIAFAAVVLLLAACGNSGIVGKWRMSGIENQTIWEFSSNGSVQVGDIPGRYKFGDQDRIKIETPFSTAVYLVKISSDQLVLQEPGGSKLEFTRIHETQR